MGPNISRALQQIAVLEYQLRQVARAALSLVEDTQDEIVEASSHGEDSTPEDITLLAQHQVYLKHIIDDMV